MITASSSGSRRGSRLSASLSSIPGPLSTTAGGHTSGYGDVFASDLYNCYNVGEFHSIFITVTNRSRQDLCLDMAVKPYQDSINGGIETNLQQKMMWLGSLSTSLPPVRIILSSPLSLTLSLYQTDTHSCRCCICNPFSLHLLIFPLSSLSHTPFQIKPGQSYTHELSVCFISMGRFHFHVCCTRRPLPQAAPQLTSPASNLPLPSFIMKRVQTETDGVGEEEKESEVREDATSTQVDLSNEQDLVYWCTTPLVIEAVQLPSSVME